jgi:membrane protein YdbS with pleckstrin-like domain
VPLSRINDTNFEHSLLERMLGCGSLVISSAGERGQVTLRDVPHVQKVQRQINELVEDTDARLSGRAPEGRPAGER